MDESSLHPEALLMHICHLQVIVAHHDHQLVGSFVLQAVCGCKHQARPHHGTTTVVLEPTLARPVLLYLHL
jgi:hypothetical protein